MILIRDVSDGDKVQVHIRALGGQFRVCWLPGPPYFEIEAQEVPERIEVANLHAGFSVTLGQDGMWATVAP